jgi:hypothetical protein
MMAKVTQVMVDNMVQLELVDLANISTLTQLRKISLEVLNDDTPCCLDTWVQGGLEDCYGVSPRNS